MRRALTIVCLLLGLALARQAAAHCTCSLPADQICPAPCATCAFQTVCCSCWTLCELDGCSPGYQQIDATLCVFPPSFQFRCEQCALRQTSTCTSCDPGYFGPQCQETICGDVNDDGFVDQDDVDAFRAYLADPDGAALGPEGESKCTVIGTAGPCDVLDVVVIRRSLEAPALPPGRAPVCAAVAGP